MEAGHTAGRNACVDGYCKYVPTYFSRFSRT